MQQKFPNESAIDELSKGFHFPENLFQLSFKTVLFPNTTTEHVNKFYRRINYNINTFCEVQS